MPARRIFSIIARHKGLGGGVNFVLPLRVLAWPHNPGVSTSFAETVVNSNCEY
jgi:hypothetical protein